MLAVDPDIVLVDVSHQVAPQAIDEGAYLLESIWRYFPPETVHLAVVDPGVGTARRAVAIAAPHGRFVGPDNGLFTGVLRQQEAIDPGSGQLTGAHAVELTNRRFHLPDRSTTFHGRDIFAPAAAHLAAGVPLPELGNPIATLVLGAENQPVIEDGVIRGSVRRIDAYGNAITTIPRGVLPEMPRIRAGDTEIDGLSQNFQEREISALIGSTGFLEIVVRNGSAVERLRLSPGDEVVVRAVR